MTETMRKSIYQLKFLESTENLKSILSMNSGRSVSHRLCSNIVVCLEQGRSFFEIAGQSPLEIRPLIVFYGMMGFARAVTMARTLKNIETLPQRHGLQDVSPKVATLDSLVLKVTASGTFDAMNDSVVNLEKFIVHIGSEVSYVRSSTAQSQTFHNSTFTLRDILSRIYSIREHYLDTFNENAKVVGCSHFSGSIVESHKFLSFDVFTEGVFKSKEDLFRVVRDLRGRFAFLKNWGFERASWAGGFTSIKFTNKKYAGKNPVDSSDVMPEVISENSFGYTAQHYGTPVYDDDILSKTHPIAGGISGNMDTHIIESFNGIFLSELALFYMGMFLLSSLVRYRPDIWSNALSRRAVSNNPVDDKALSLIEHFIEISLSIFPQHVVAILKEPFS